MQKVKFSEVCKISNGFAFKSDKYVNIEGGRVIRITNVQKGRIIDNYPKFYPFSELKNLESYKINEDDILMSLTGNVGRVGKFPKELLPAYINQRVCRIKSKSNKLLDDYLYHFLNSNIFENDAIRNSAGAAQLNLSANWLLDYEIPLPDLKSQQKIAEILDIADQLRQYNKQLIAKYDALIQSLFLEMFGDPVRNEKGWEMKKLSIICEKITDGTHQSPKFIKSGIPFLLVSNIIKNKIDFTTKKFISEEDFNILNSRTPIEIGNILYTSVGSYGNPAIIETETKFAFQRHIAFLKPKHSKINFRFLFEILKTDSFKREVDKKVKGAAQKTLNLIELKNFEIPVPPLSLQNQFAERVQMIETQKEQAQEALAKSEDLFQGLLQRAFKGELI